MKDHTGGKITEHTDLIAYFDGACEPQNPGGVCTSAWVLFDAKSNDRLAAEGKVVRDGRKAKPPDKLATNNFAEYCALGLMLRFLVDNKWRGTIAIYGDSKLIVNQVTHQWKLKAQHLKPLREKVWEHLETLELELCSGDNDPTYDCSSCDMVGPTEELIDVSDEKQSEMMVCPHCGNVVTVFNPPTNASLKWVPREQNEEADALSHATYEHYVKGKR